MAKIITVKYERPVRESAFVTDLMVGDPVSSYDVAGMLAGPYKRYDGKADFIIVDSADFSNMCLEGECFFEDDVRRVLQGEIGFEDVQVRGLMSGSYPDVRKRIQEELPGEIEYLDGVESAENPVLYRLQREGSNPSN